MRLDRYVAETRPDHSRSTWQKLIKSGHVKVDDMVVDSPKFEVSNEHSVTITDRYMPDFSDAKLEIIYEDDNVIVIDKPAGILTHAKGALSDEFTVAEFVRSKTSYKSDTNRPGIVHRLDRDTSGVILCVKNEATASYIQKQFSNRTVKKRYSAVVIGTPELPEAVIRVPIGRNPAAPSTFKPDPNGKPAETAYVVEASDGHHSLVGLRPKTGRTHQLRVHMKYIGTPILGDRIYGQEADRLYLHARSLEVTLPGGERTMFSSEVPRVFREVVR